MKTFLAFVLLFTALSAFSANEPVPTKVTGPFIRITGDFNSRSQGCQGGLGLCSVFIQINDFYFATYSIGNATIEGNNLVITFTEWNRSDNPTEMDVTDGDANVFNGAAAIALGYESVVLLPGTYTVTTNSSNQKVVYLPAEIH